MIERLEKKKKGLIAPDINQDENVKIEITLRPQTLKDYIGQDEIKRNLSVFIEASKSRGEQLEHVLLHGPPGLGKTTLAHIIAREMGVNIRVTSGPALEKQGDLASIITNLRENDILFIDEIHRLKPVVEEVLYTAMEDFGLDLIIGKGPSARSMRLKLPKFTLLGATTRMSMLSAPLRDRFGSLLHLDFYTHGHIQEIIKRSAQILDVNISNEAAARLSLSARQTPRIANRLLRRVRDFANVKKITQIEFGLVEDSLKALNIDEAGLDKTDRDILETIIDKFDGGPVGLNTIAAATQEDQDTIESIYEPYLLKLGLLDRTPRGRIATRRAYEHLGINMVEQK